MSRGLTASQITNLQQQSYRIEDLLEIYLLTNFFYTTGAIDVSVSTTTSSGTQTFKARSFISDVSSINETFEPQATDISVQFQRLSDGGVDDVFLARLDTAEIIGKRIVMYKLFRNISTIVPDTTNGLIQVFDGTISGLEVEYATDNTIWTLRATGDFGDYDKIRGRSTSSISGALQNRIIYWGSFYLR